MIEERTSLRELALLFIRLGATAFGGPAVHIAMMRDEIVRRRKWMSEERFLDLVSATNLIPGPNSTEMAIHIGWDRRGWEGLLVSGIAFIVPAVLVTGVIGWAYVRFGSMPTTGWLLYGVKPAILGVVVQAIWVLARAAVRTSQLRILAVGAGLLAIFGVNELIVLFGSGLLSLAISRVGDVKKASAMTIPTFICWTPVAAGSAAAAFSLSSLFWVFVKTGSVLFGSGYVLLAFLRSDLVERLGWLTEAQLLDAVSVGQMTPGPVFTTATFIGYVLKGPIGATLATVGIFLPAFVFVALSSPIVPRIRASPQAGAFFDGVNVASFALMAVVTVQLGRAALVDVPTGCLGVLGATLLLRFRVNSSWLVLGGGLFGLGAHAIGLVR